jgi:membrane associated rhomboid family serine protease
MGRRASPTIETAIVALLFSTLAILSAVESAFLPADPIPPLVLRPPLAAEPWTLVTAVYAHWNLSHLLANGLALLIVRTSRLRFHAFFLVTGMLAGVGEVLAHLAVNNAVAVAGMSGAVFALLGYLLAGNVATQAILARIDLSPKVQIALVLVVAVGLTLVTASPGVALIGHATGLVLGLVAGGLGLLDVDHR